MAKNHNAFCTTSVVTRRLVRSGQWTACRMWVWQMDALGGAISLAVFGWDTVGLLMVAGGALPLTWASAGLGKALDQCLGDCTDVSTKALREM